MRVEEKDRNRKVWFILRAILLTQPRSQHFIQHYEELYPKEQLSAIPIIPILLDSIRLCD